MRFLIFFVFYLADQFFYVIVPNSPALLNCILTKYSPRNLYFDNTLNQGVTGSNQQFVTLPNLTTVVPGTTFQIELDSHGEVEFQLNIRKYSTSGNVLTMTGTTRVFLTAARFETGVGWAYYLASGQMSADF